MVTIEEVEQMNIKPGTPIELDVWWTWSRKDSDGTVKETRETDKRIGYFLHTKRSSDPIYDKISYGDSKRRSIEGNPPFSCLEFAWRENDKDFREEQLNKGCSVYEERGINSVRVVGESSQ